MTRRRVILVLLVVASLLSVIINFVGPFYKLLSPAHAASGQNVKRDGGGWIEESPEEKRQRLLDEQDPGAAFENEVDREFAAGSSGFGAVGTGSTGDSTGVDTSDGRTTLKIGVKHSATLAPIPTKLQAGGVFNENLMPAEPEKLDWYRIPYWLAGKWRRDIETSLFTYKYASRSGDRENRSFQSQQQADFGLQRDRIGGIWDANLSSRGVSDLGSYLAIAAVVERKPVKLTASEIVFREEFTVVHVNKSNAVIIDSFRMESLTKYRLLNGTVYTTASVKAYNADGSPKQLQKNVAQERRVQPFVVIDKYKGRDVRGEFLQFLNDSGQPNLIPR
jgi:hypothetical protein